MAKLVLKGLMWGVDKVPDDWFDKIPGSYYKAKDETGKLVKHHKPHPGHHETKQKGSRRRHSEDHDRRREEDMDDGYRSDGHGRHSSRKSARDGSYDLANGRPRRERSRPDQYRADKRRSHDSRLRDGPMEGLYSYHDGPVQPRMNGAAASAAMADGPPAEQAPGIEGSYVNGSYTPGSVPGSPQQNQHFDQQLSHLRTPTSTLRGGMSTGYVPYANIYGEPPLQQQQEHTPAALDIGSIQPNSMNQVTAPRKVAKQQYHQNPFAQDAPLGNQPGYIPDPYHNVRQYNNQSNTQYEGDGSEAARRFSRSPSPGGRSRRDDYSPSQDSYDSRRDHRRARSERRDRRDDAKPPKRGKSRIQDAFDTSHRGLGYSAVGALAGGLVGNELGKGGLSTGVGAAVGALASNAFEARERKHVVDP